MADFAIIATGGKQYKVRTGDKVQIEKLEAAIGDVITFDQVLLSGEGENVKIGTPTISGATVMAKVTDNYHDRTKIIFKYHSKTRHRRKKGHRQLHTEVEITKI